MPAGVKVLSIKLNEIVRAIVHEMTREEPSNNFQLAATTAPLNSLIVFNKGKFNEDVCSRLRHLQLKSNLINILLSICRRGRAASPLCNMFSMTHFCPTLQSDSLPFNTL